jgi:hypothetical protein
MDVLGPLCLLITMLIIWFGVLGSDPRSYYDSIFEQVVLKFNKLHPYNYQIRKTECKQEVIIHCYPCVSLGENDFEDIKCNLIDLWKKVQLCKTGNDINNLVNSLVGKQV